MDFCSILYTSPPIQKLYPHSDIISKIIQAHLFHNTSYSGATTLQVFCLPWCHMQVHLSRNNIPTVKPPPNIQAHLPQQPSFSQHVLEQCCNPPGILSSIVGILLFNSVFHDRVTPVSVSTLKPLLRIIGVLLLKPQASPILSVCIKD